MYATLQALRNEGITREDALDARATAALQDASDLIDRACGWFFEPRELGFLLSGRGASAIELPAPPIRLDHIRIGCELYAPQDFAMVGAPIAAASLCMPKLIFRDGAFPRGVDNIWVHGLWGYTVPCTESSQGATPRPIQRATLMLAQRLLPKLSDDDAISARNQWRLVEERTRDQSYRMEPTPAGTLTGDPEVDAILVHYRRPFGLGCT